MAAEQTLSRAAIAATFASLAMKAPQYEVADALHTAISLAASVLSHAIERVETVGPFRFRISDGTRSVVIQCEYENSYGPGGVAMPRSGHWYAHTMEEGAARQQPRHTPLQRWLTSVGLLKHRDDPEGAN